MVAIGIHPSAASDAQGAAAGPDGWPLGSCRQRNRSSPLSWKQSIAGALPAFAESRGQAPRARIASSAGAAQAIESMLVRVHAGVPDLPVETGEEPSSTRNEIN